MQYKLSVLKHDVHSIEYNVFRQQVDFCVFRHKAKHCALKTVLQQTKFLACKYFSRSYILGVLGIISVFINSG